MSSQRKRPNKQSAKTSPIHSAKPARTSMPTPATKATTPASKSPSQPLSAVGKAPVTGSQSTAAKTTTSARSTTGKLVTKSAYAPSAAVALPAPGVAARVVRAFTSAFPFAGLEYVIFLGVVETNVLFAVPVGLIALGLACGVFFLKQQALLRQETSESRLLGGVRQWLGDPLVVAGSLALLGASLIAFARWSATGAHGFSVVASIALIAAMLLLFVANYRRDAQPA